MFSNDKLNAEVAKEKWDIIKVLCTQPFNKNIKYGLSFITIHSAENVEPKKEPLKLGAFTLKDEDEDDDTGQLFQAKKLNVTNSVASDLRSDSTLATLALKSEVASKKRKDSPKTDFSTASKKQKLSTPQNVKNDKKLPRRNFIDPEDEQEPTSTPPLSKNENRTPKPSTYKKDSNKKKDKPPEAPKSVKQPLGKPFNKLMDGVVFVISGLQNPLRGEVRQKALEMGAKYKGDWDSSCTHLICEFMNTPKFNQVKGKGKIVKKEWIVKCYSEKKRLPWRRFCLDRNDQGDESEEEIWEESLLPHPSSSNSTSVNENKTVSTVPNTNKLSEDEYDKDTDDELNELREAEKNKKGKCK